jgi:hypothetical protein
MVVHEARDPGASFGVDTNSYFQILTEIPITDIEHNVTYHLPLIFNSLYSDFCKL